MLRDTHALEIAGTSRCLPIFEKKIQLTSADSHRFSPGIYFGVLTG